MNSITQELENEFRKIIYEAFFSVSLRYWSKPIDNFFYSSPEIAYIKSMLSLHKCSKEIILESIKLSISKIDNFYSNSSYRMSNFYKCKLVSRTIITIFGELTFERFYYTDKSKKNGFFLIDEIFNFEKYTTYDPLIRAILINQSVTQNINSTATHSSLLLSNYEGYMSNIKEKNIPRQTIYNWIKNWNIPKIEYKYLGENIKQLYVMADEKWIHEQLRLATLEDEEKEKKHFIMGKCFVTFTGSKTKNGRTQLLNRHIIYDIKRKIVGTIHERNI